MKMTFNALREIDADITKQAKTSAAFGILMAPRIKHFYKQNARRVKELHDTINELVAIYVEHDADNKAMVLLNDEDGTSSYKFKTEEDRQQYVDKLTPFLKREIEVFV